MAVDRFSFCSRGCRDEFLAAPYRFFADPAASGAHQAALREAARHEGTLPGRGSDLGPHCRGT